MYETEIHTRSREEVYIGLDIGKTKLAAGLITEHGEILLRNEIRTDVERGGEVIVDQCRNLIREMLGFSKIKPEGIGVGSSGVVNPEKGIVVSSGSITGWQNVRIKDRFEEEFKIPVKVDNDVNVAALGEHFFGAGKGVFCSVFMVISTGVGFSTIREGKIWRGSHNLAGQIAHLKLFNKDKTVNDVFSGKGISQTASEMLGRDVSTEEVFRLASKGKAEAELVIQEAIKKAALTIAWIHNTIDPDVFIIGGGVALNEKEFLDQIRSMAEQFLVKYKAQLPKGLNMRLPLLGDDAGLLGGVALFANK